MNTPFQSIIRPAVCASLVAGVALGWFARGWLTRPDAERIAAPATLPTPSAHPPDERSQLTDAPLEKTQAGYAELVRERDRLARTNTVLNDARLQAEKGKAHAEQTMEFLSGITSKLLGADQLQVPQTVAEAAVFSGRLNRTTQDFHAKWGAKAPPEGTPEFAAYHQEMDALTTDAAAMLKSMGANSVEDIVKKPGSVAQFQSLQLYGALQLNDAQWSQLDGTLNRYYAEGFSRKLEGASRPETGVDAWQQQRAELSQRAFSDIQSLLTPPQRADFERLYQPSFLWNINIGGQ